MDEVDKIIIHSLKQIGCRLEFGGDSEIFKLQHFTPDLLVKAVSKCLQEIKNDIGVPNALPENIAHRFTVASILAEMCHACGYRGDIGYQTFLYPNEVDIRRLFMFLIEQLPKDPLCTSSNAQQDKDEFDILMLDVRKQIQQQLRAPWIPQYCRGIGKKKDFRFSSLCMDFIPHLNLSIPKSENFPQGKQSIVNYQIPNIFQQIALGDCELISSVLHKNAIDVYAPSDEQNEDLRLISMRAMQTIVLSPVKSLAKALDKPGHIPNKTENIIKTPLEYITNEIEYLKIQNQKIYKEREIGCIKLNELRQRRSDIKYENQNMKKACKIHERTFMILENAEENINKLENLIEKTRERHLAMENQWLLHRNPALQQIVDLKTIRESKNQHSVHELRSTIQQLQISLAEKNNNHTVLEDELKKGTSGIALRREYTRRIYEFIGNIRKQRNDIYKILDDTRDLQKQLNSVSAQLQRQFNYTDDLLFQSAKHDLHAKQAYKFLASLHASCDEIYDLVSRTGHMTKDSRDFEVQIDRERMRNVASSLENINLDIKKFEIIIKKLKSEISEVQNEIQSG